MERNCTIWIDLKLIFGIFEWKFGIYVTRTAIYLFCPKAPAPYDSLCKEKKSTVYEETNFNSRCDAITHTNRNKMILSEKLIKYLIICFQNSEREKSTTNVCNVNFPFNTNNVINSRETSKSYAPNVKWFLKGNWIERFRPLDSRAFYEYSLYWVMKIKWVVSCVYRSI